MITNLFKFIFAVSIFVLSGVASAAIVNINTASASALSQHLSGIGEKKAELIVAYRKKHGSFKNIEDIVNVKGIGQGLLNKNKAVMSLTQGVVDLTSSKAKEDVVVITSKKKTKLKAPVKKQVAAKVSKGSKMPADMQ